MEDDPDLYLVIALILTVVLIGFLMLILARGSRR
jgi:hypothetical protein